MKKKKKQIIPISMATPGKEVVLVAITGGRQLRNRLQDMGLSKGCCLRILNNFKPGPCIIQLGESKMALGHGMAEKIMVSEIE